MRVLLATGIEQLDKDLRDRLGENASICYYREAVVQEARKFGAEVVVLSADLPGSFSLEELILALRMADTRVIFLPGDVEKNKALVEKAVGLGIYDLVPNPLSAAKVIERIERPAGLKDVGRLAREIKGLPEEIWQSQEEDVASNLPEGGPSRRVGEGLFRMLGQVCGATRKPAGALVKLRKPEGEGPPASVPELVMEFEPAPFTPLPSLARVEKDVTVQAGTEQVGTTCVGAEQAETEKASLRQAGSEGVEGGAGNSGTPWSEAVVFCLGDVPGFPGVRRFSSLAELAAALGGVKPDAAVVGPGAGDVTVLAKELRRLAALSDVPVGVVGGGAECYAAGADDCFEKLTEEALARLLQKKERLQGLWADASKDELTGCHTRKFLESHLRMLSANWTPFAVLMCDLDHFKKVNDTHGHPAGDTVLREFGVFLREGVREADVVARYGGEEFVVVLPRTGRGEASEIAERLRRGWQEKGVYGSTFSGGVAEYGRDGRTAREVVEAADRALYVAKADGRNNVKLAGERPQGHPAVLVPRLAAARLAVRVFVVIGTSRRVGATAFALGLAARAASKYPVEVIDAGGGASRWLRDGIVPCRKAPPLSVVPGVVTIIDAGLEASGEAFALAQEVFVVTDVSVDAVTVRPPVSGGYLVGGRGAPEGVVKELARLWSLEYFGCLPEAQGVKQAELAGDLPRPRSWRKLLARITL